MGRPSWRVASACEIGTSHVGSGTPCQDYSVQATIQTKDGPVLVVIVCDGAGSAIHSEIGSWLASTTFLELVEVHFENGGSLVDIDRTTAADWIGRTADRLIARAKDDDNSPKDYSCTLLAAVVGDQAAVFVQIGDGAIVVSHGGEDGWNWVFWPQHGEYANQTVFILSSNAVDELQFDLAPRQIDEFAVFSDGIERLVLHAATKTVNDKFFDQMFAPIRASTARGLDKTLSAQLQAYLGSSVVNARTNDDKTLVMATRRPR